MMKGELFAGAELERVIEVGDCQLCLSQTKHVDTGGTRCLECARDTSDAAVLFRREINQWWRSLSPTGARFSDCQKYRYELWRKWSDAPPWIALMLNPSTADEVANDPTVERQERRARTSGRGGLIVLNIFAYRSTIPQVLPLQADPVGPENNETIKRVCRMPGSIVVCGWGQHGRLGARGDRVATMLRNLGVSLYCLGVNKDGSPAHPLYIGYDKQPFPYER